MDKGGEMTGLEAIKPIPDDALVDLSIVGTTIHLHFMHDKTVWCYSGPDFEHMKLQSWTLPEQPANGKSPFVRLEGGQLPEP